MFQKKWGVLSVFIIAVILFSANLLWARGLRVSPGAFCAKNVEVGKDTDLGIDLVVYNSSDKIQRFILNTAKPSEIKKHWIKGYDEIPDPEWFYFEKSILEGAPNSEGKTRMYVKIPDEERYYNQHWMVFVAVTSAQNGRMFEAGIKANYMIETQSKEDVNEHPYGNIAVSPSVTAVESVVRGEKNKLSFNLYNNTDRECKCKLCSYIPAASNKKQDISCSPGCKWLSHKNCIRPLVKQVLLRPGEKKRIFVECCLPDEEEDKNGEPQLWEGIVMIEPDEGSAQFVRVLMNEV